ncbi:hypothetical protein HanPSC8_Chr03g0124831 [Helianthus annuus]|nr:hypothetical protein HanPSC8_Chr03g0124831 [Helianthus annuus]
MLRIIHLILQSITIFDSTLAIKIDEGKRGVVVVQIWPEKTFSDLKIMLVVVVIGVFFPYIYLRLFKPKLWKGLFNPKS